MNAEKARALLMMPYNQHGSYLIRYSATNLGQYVLSLRNKETVAHYRIYQLQNGTFILDYRDHGEMPFNTITELVAYYQKESHSFILPVNLIHHCIIQKDDQTVNLPSQKWEIERRKISLVAKLLEGEFSEVWEGLWNGTKRVTVKICKPQMTPSHFLYMASLLIKLHNTSGVIQLYGLCSKNEPVWIITESTTRGSLLNYLHAAQPPLPKVSHMVKEVVLGMTYLEMNNIIHRDLAARNILIGDDLCCKVANFEMAKEESNTFEACNETRITYRWTAPEAAIQKIYSIKSDVWSFGMVLYEMTTHGLPPYPGTADDEVLNLLQSGYHMPRPDKCPERLHDIMLGCWRQEPENRYTFKALEWEFYRIENATNIYIYPRPNSWIKANFSL